MLFKTLGILLGISLTSAMAHAAEPTGVAAAPTATPVTVAGEPHTADAALQRDEPAERPHAYRWYGAPTLGVDAASLGLAVLAFKADSAILAYASMGSFALGGPINHLTQGNGGRAAASLGMRVALPVLLGVGGAFIPGACDRHACIGPIVGVFAGMAAASAIDTAALSYKEVPEKRSAIAPVLAVGKDMAYVGASGQF
jgi:hypothetical protein